MATVSPTVKSVSIPMRLQFSWMNPASKKHCGRSAHSLPQNSRNFGKISSITGASMTISSLILVSCSISNGMGSLGFTKVLNRSTILPSMTLTAPILNDPVVDRRQTGGLQVKHHICTVHALTFGVFHNFLQVIHQISFHSIDDLKVLILGNGMAGLGKCLHAAMICDRQCRHSQDFARFRRTAASVTPSISLIFVWQCSSTRFL